MIFVTLGTQDKSFHRLLELIDEEIEKKQIKEEVIAQVGYTKYQSKNMKIIDYLPKPELEEQIAKCRILITHAGVGSIFDGLKNNKKIIVVPRLSKYQEHVNDHQIQIASELEKEGYVISVTEKRTQHKALKEIEKFTPKKYKSNNKNMIKLVENYIDNHERRKPLKQLLTKFSLKK